MNMHCYMKVDWCSIKNCVWPHHHWTSLSNVKHWSTKVTLKGDFVITQLPALGRRKVWTWTFCFLPFDEHAWIFDLPAKKESIFQSNLNKHFRLFSPIKVWSKFSTGTGIIWKSDHGQQKLKNIIIRYS